MTRENFYVAMTRGKDSNRAYVITDTPDDAHAHPSEESDPIAAARRVLYGVLRHSGAELSAHETTVCEQEKWGSIQQLAAEYETIAAEAQRDRWIALIQASGLTDAQIQQVIESEAFGALTAELRRAEANQHPVDSLLPRLVRARGFEDADEIAFVLHHRLERATIRPARTGRSRQAPRLIAGLIPIAEGVTDPEMRQALTERQQLIEERASSLAHEAITADAPWVQDLGLKATGPRESEMWERCAETVAAYRDRYSITDPDALGPAADRIAQRIDQARAEQALRRARILTEAPRQIESPSEPIERAIAHVL